VLDPKKGFNANRNEFFVCHFKDTKFNSEVPPHLYVHIPINDKAFVLIAIITSKVKEKKEYYKRTNPQNVQSLVEIDQVLLPILEKTSVIDCNQAESIQIRDFTKRIDPQIGFEIKGVQITSSLQEEIIAAIHNSSIVSPLTKELIS
jgi:hypothetical protein